MEKAQQLPSGRWRVRFTDPDGRRRSVTDDTARRASKRAAVEMSQRIERAKPEASKPPANRFDRFAEDWLFTRRPGEPNGYAPTSYRKRQHHLRALNKTFGQHDVQDVTPALVRAWWSQNSTTPSARHSKYWFLHAVFQVALDDELITRNPCRVKGASADPAKTRPTFTDDDVLKIFEATTDEQMRAIEMVLMGSALRVGELVALDWEDVALLEGRVHVSKHWTPLGIASGTKTGATDARVIDLPQWVLSVIESVYPRGRVAEGPVFRNREGGRLSVDGVGRQFRRIREVAGVPEMHIHDLRHVALTRYAQQPGVTLADLQAFGGHRTAKTAMRYQHVPDERAAMHAKNAVAPRWMVSANG